MLHDYYSTLDQRLREAEEAESQLSRLGPLAAEAPQLRDAVTKARVASSRHQKKQEAMKSAREAADLAAEAQRQAPELLHAATKAVKELYKAFRTADTSRQTAAQALAIADRMDYELELAESEDREISLDRDPRGLAYVLAAQHGEVRVKKMLEELDPDFSFLRDCDIEEPIHRDLANFVVAHAVRRTTASPVKPEPHREPQPEPKPAPVPEARPEPQQLVPVEAFSQV